MNTTLIYEQPTRHQSDVTTIEQYQKRRIQRRRRVAKRKYLAGPLFVVEEMQDEFPGYTFDELVADLTRKTRKGKSKRTPKKTGFDWDRIRKEIPTFFWKCMERTKTTAKLRFRLKGGREFHVEVRSVWFADQSQQLFRTGDLIKLWEADNLKNFLSHPAVIFQPTNNEI